MSTERPPDAPLRLAQHGSGTTVLLERREALEAVNRVLSQTQSGGGGAIFVVGEAGLGKTRVLDSALRVARNHFSAGVGRGDPMEASLPFGVLTQALGELGGEVVLETEIPAPAAEIRASRFLRVQQWLAARGGPTLLAFDDLHWADPDSLALLSFVVRRVRSMPVVILGTLRPWPDQAARIANDRHYAGDAELVRLRPLSSAAAATIIEREVPVPVAPDLLERAISLCQGNPLMLEELARAIGRREEFPEPADMAAPGALYELLLARFGQLPETAARVASAASVLGVRFYASVAIELANIAEGEADAALKVLWSCGVVREVEGEHMEFVHPLLCQALYDDIPPPLRARLHARAFARLASRGLVRRAAKHVTSGGLAGDGMARRVVEQAAAQALRLGAPATAVTQLTPVIEAAGEESEVSLLATLVDALMATGSLAQADVICQRVVDHRDATVVERASGLRTLGRLNYLLARHDRSLENFAGVVRLVRETNPDIACQALIDLVLSGTFFASTAQGRTAAESAVALSKQCDPTLQRRAAAASGFTALQRGTRRDSRVSRTSSPGRRGSTRQRKTRTGHGVRAWRTALRPRSSSDSMTRRRRSSAGRMPPSAWAR